MSNNLKSIELKLEKATNAFERVDLLNQLAWELRGVDIHKALSLIQESSALAKSCNDQLGYLESIKTTAYLQLKLSHHDISFQKAIEALGLARQLNNKVSEAFVLNVLGNNSYALGDYENALKYHLLTLNLRKQIDDKGGEISALLNIGSIYAMTNELDIALDFYLKGEELFGKVSGITESVSIVYGNIGSIYAMKGMYEKAITYYDKSLKADTAHMDIQVIPNCHNNLGELYLKLNDFEKSREHYKKGFEIALNTGYRHGEAKCLIGLATLAVKKKELQSAEEFILKAIEIGNSLNLDSVLSTSYELFADLSAQKGDYENAFEFHKKFHSLKEKNFNEESERKKQNLLVLHRVDTLKQESEHHRVSNDELKQLNEYIEEKNRSIMENIDYAKHIQDSILPHPSNLKHHFLDSFIFHRAKDVISGDFFWLFEKENEVLVAAVDCTGHGVSGALMSVVSNSLLNQVASNQWMPNPAFILNEANHYFQRTLASHDESGLRDSMDIALCSFAKTKTEMLFSGAHNPLYIISDGVLTEYKGDNISLGNSASVKFNNHRIKLKKGDCLYLFTDGFADQKGGSDRKKFYYEPFKKMLLDMSTLSMEKQKSIMEKRMADWMGEEKQIDDMLVVGIRI